MSAATRELYEELQRRQVQLVVNDGQLELDWPIDDFDPLLVERVQRAEAELVAYLDGLKQAMQSGGQALAGSALSFAQQRLWLIDQIERSSTQYHLPIALRLRGELDRSALQRSFDVLLDRHEMLRTVFVVEDGQPLQRVSPPQALAITEYDLGHLPVLEREQRVHSIRGEEARLPFDLSTGPMLRVRLIDLSDPNGSPEHVLLVTQHHIASDGWSINIFVREFCELYGAFRVGAPSPLAPLPGTYATFSTWQRQRLAGSGPSEAYWMKQLEGATGLHDLPLDRPRPAVQSFEGARLYSQLDGATFAGIKTIARAHRCTLFMVLQAAFNTLVHRRSGRDDIVLGVPVAGRTHEHLEPLVGMFVNTLLLRSRVRPGLRFSDYLQQVRQTALEAYEHQEVPFDLLVDLIKPERSRSHGPLFQLMLSLQEGGSPSIDLPGLEVERLPGEGAHVKCDLELEAIDQGDHLGLRWTYATALFDAATLQRMNGELLCLLRGIVADPDTALAQLPMLPPEEVAMLADWNQTTVPFPHTDTLIGLFEATVGRSPHLPALVFDDQRWTYQQLDTCASRLARRLRDEHGALPGARIGLCVPRSPDMVVALLAILKAGSAYVALDPEQPVERMAHMLADSAASIVLVAGGHAAGQFANAAARVVDIDGVAAPPVALADPGVDFPSQTSAGDTAYIIYTSGSTGAPKGTVNLHRGPCNRIRALQHQFPLSAADRVMHKTPLGFDVSVWELFWPLSVGATVVLVASQGHKDPLYLARVVAAQRVTVIHFVPSMLQMFLRGIDGAGLGSLRYVMTSGEALSVELQQRSIDVFSGATLVNHYGPTETGIEVSWWPFNTLRADRAVPIGRPIANCRLHVLDALGQPVPIGVTGELHIGGIQVGEGYLNNPVLTAERFVTLSPVGMPERLYRTGDLARWLPDGQVEYLGRLDSQVKLRGMRVELAEIERRAREHARIEDAVVLVTGELADQHLMCYLVARAGVQDSPDNLVADVRQFLSRTLPGYMTHCRYVLLEQLPLSPNGKVDRQALLRTQAAPARDRGVASVPVASHTERLLANIWSERLGIAVDQIGTTDSFFEIGGNSLLSIAVQGDIKRDLDMEIAVADLFQYPTIAHLAHFIDGQAETSLDRSPALQQAKDRLLRARSRRKADT